MRPRILVEHLKPGQPADDIGSQAHRFFHKFSRARIANNAFLQEALIEMNMPVDVVWHNQVSGSIHFRYRFISEVFSYCRYAIPSDPDVPGALAASQMCMANDQVHW